MLRAAQGTTTLLASRLSDAAAAFVSAISAAGGQVKTDGSVPDAIRRDVVAYGIWWWLSDFPALRAFKTDERKAASARAEATLKAISLREFGAIESPYGTDTSSGNWNCVPKIIGRMSPVPLPSQQLQSVPSPLYANPNAVPDTVPPNDPELPKPPLGLVATAGNASVALQWDPVDNAVSYTVYRGTTQGQEAVLQAGVTTDYYQDSTAVNGTPYWYFVKTVNAAGTSGASQEVSATPLATIV